MLPGVVPASSYQPPKPIWDRFIRYSDCLRLSLPISFVPGHLEKRQMLKSPHPFPTALQCDTSDTWTPLSASCIHLMFLLLFLLRSNLPGSVWSWSAESTRQPWQPGQLGPGLCLFCFVLFCFVSKWIIFGNMQTNHLLREVGLPWIDPSQAHMISTLLLSDRSPFSSKVVVLGKTTLTDAMVDSRPMVNM